MISKSHLGLLTGKCAASDVPGTQVGPALTIDFPTREIFRTDLQNIPGQEILFFTTDWTPGLRLPWHAHPDGHEFAYVVRGELTFEIEGLGEKIVKAGEVLYTPPNVRHYGRNATSNLTKTVVVRIKDKGQPTMVEVNR